MGGHPTSCGDLNFFSQTVDLQRLRTRTTRTYPGIASQIGFFFSPWLHGRYIGGENSSSRIRNVFGSIFLMFGRVQNNHR